VRLTEELAELGCEYAVLSGGEPLLRQDWPVLARSFRSHGVTVGMISNGILMDAMTAKAVKASGVSVVAVSVDGLEATHDRIRQREGAFRAALRALRNAADEGLRIHVVTHVNRLNRVEVPHLQSVLEEIGVRTWLVQLSAPMGRMKARRDLILDREEVRELATWLAKAREGGRIQHRLLLSRRGDAAPKR
jgi:MoaA/NifB/PqqE/SkfB family radical SAM enzyme